MNEVPAIIQDLVWLFSCLLVLIVLATIQALCARGESKQDPERWLAVEFFASITLAFIAMLVIGLASVVVYNYVIDLILI